MEIVGFVHIKEDATTCKGAINPGEFKGEICPVMEFDSDGGALVLNPKGSALGMFEKQDIDRRFKCTYKDGIVMPPELDMVGQVTYMAKARSRKGGYNSILARMVIQNSLSKGEFNDNFIWVRQ